MKENKFMPHAFRQSERSRRLKTGTFKDVLAIILMKNSCPFDFHFQIFKFSNFQIIFFIFLFQLANAQHNKIDKFTYTNSTVNNQLLFINDPIPANASAVDIDNQSSTNYAYNANGQLTKDEQQNIDTIIWNVNGKVKEVQKTNGDIISFKYDALGNRIVKQLTTNNGQLTTTFYTRNASGQVIAIYEKQNTDSIKLSELTISGIGILNEEINHLQASVSNEPNYRIINKKSYELKDHLGNVRIVVSDKKQSSFVNNQLSTLNVELLTAIDYYSYGMQMPGRNYKTENYRYGIQGKEKDNELAGNGNAYDFGARILDPRVGRWLSTDPLADIQPSMSSYASMGNNPVNRIDLDGKEDMHYGVVLYGDMGASVAASLGVVVSPGNSVSYVVVITDNDILIFSYQNSTLALGGGLTLGSNVSAGSSGGIGIMHDNEPITLKSANELLEGESIGITFDLEAYTGLGVGGSGSGSSNAAYNTSEGVAISSITPTVGVGFGGGGEVLATKTNSTLIASGSLTQYWEQLTTFETSRAPMTADEKIAYLKEREQYYILQRRELARQASKAVYDNPNSELTWDQKNKIVAGITAACESDIAEIQRNISTAIDNVRSEDK